MTTYKAVGVVAAVVLSLIFPFLVNEKYLDVAVQILIASLFAMSFNILNGRAGLLSFGHAAFFGLGAFATVHAMNATNGAVPLPFVPLAGWISGLLAGLLFGWFATKRSGVYFSMITLALAELLYSMAPHLSSTFGGEAGISTMRTAAFGVSFATDQDVYYLVLAWVLVAVALIYYLSRSPFGQVLAGLKDNRSRMRFLGYDTHHLGWL
ncbi:MAG TPA: branched-chain amino acid ABC transporter permease, partial [Rhizobium sp.]